MYGGAPAAPNCGGKSLGRRGWSVEVRIRGFEPIRVLLTDVIRGLLCVAFEYMRGRIFDDLTGGGCALVARGLWLGNLMGKDAFVFLRKS